MKTKRGPLTLDWNKLLPPDESPPHSPIIISEQRSSAMNVDVFVGMTDDQLHEAIKRKTEILNGGRHKLADNGEKLRVCIKQYEKEREKRRLRRAEKVVYVCERPTQSKRPDVIGAFDSFKKQGAPSTAPKTQSLFASSFLKRTKKDRTDYRTDNAFHKEFSYFGRCDRQKMKHNGQSSQNGRLTSKEWARQYTRDSSIDEDYHVLRNEEQKSRAFSTSTTWDYKGLTFSLGKKRSASEREIPSSKNVRPKTGQTIDLVDEEEPQIIDTLHEEEQLNECFKGSTIYYPSRGDPECVEINFSDMKCLAPAAYLTSTIMNFYIRHLQQPSSTTVRDRCDYHFFNTYFYKKLKEAVLYKGSEKETVFIRFRRWWKGVNIFQKPYVFIPIHEDLHWSLVIICIPDKRDESGPIILHLDSLGLHNSRTIFQHITRYIKEEWNYLNQEIAPPEVHITERIWRDLPQKIEEKSIVVPQQKNDSDCGLFVLYFMKRFIEEAPDRLKTKDLSMFGRQWFKAEEASGLRRKISKLLKKEFVKAN